MANEPSWEEIFGGAQTARPSQPNSPSVEPVSQQFPTARLSDPFAVAAAEATATSAIPVQTVSRTLTAERPADPGATSRRDARKSDARRGSRGGGGSGNGRNTTDPLKKKKRGRWIPWVATLVVFLFAGGGVAWYGWSTYETQIRDLMGWQIPNDYETAGNGTEVTVVIQSGDIGYNVAQKLEAAKVTMSFDAVYDYLVANPDIGFEPGNYTLQEQMSAASAVAALQDPANRVINNVTIPEGTAAVDIYALLAAGTGLTVEDFQAAAADYTAYGVPPESPSIDGWLFPATYQFDPGVTAPQVLQRLVTEMMTRLDNAGVAPEDRFNTVRLASIIQREAGSNVDDMAKISRVFLNRIDQGMRLESDATVAYGTGNTHTVWTTDAERADASNLYNTYANDGYPIGPIGNPGDTAINAAVNPADGAWLFFVPINLKTGETKFSETASQHEAAAAQLRAWCRESAENRSYCE